MSDGIGYGTGRRRRAVSATKKTGKDGFAAFQFCTEEHKGILGHIDQKARQSLANPWVKISGNLYRFRYMFLYVYQTHMSFNEITAPGAVKRFL